MHCAGHVCRTAGTWSQIASVSTTVAQTSGSAHSKSGPHCNVDVDVDVVVLEEEDVDVVVEVDDKVFVEDDVEVEVEVEQHSGKHRAVHCNRIDGTVSQISGVIANKEHTSASQHTKSTPHFNEEGEVDVDVDVVVLEDEVVEVVVEVDVVKQHSGKHFAVHSVRISVDFSQSSGVITNAEQISASKHSKSGPHANVDVEVEVVVSVLVEDDVEDEDVVEVEVDVDVIFGQHSGTHVAGHLSRVSSTSSQIVGVSATTAHTAGSEQMNCAPHFEVFDDVEVEVEVKVVVVVEVEVEVEVDVEVVVVV